MPDRSFVLTVSCPDRVGIVHAVSGWAADRGLTITDAQQFGDASSGEFHLRMELAPTAGGAIDELRASFAPVAERFSMQHALHDLSVPHRLLVLVSRQGHVLNDLLFRVRTGQLNVQIPVIVSNHPDFAELAAWHGIPFEHVPVTPDTKPAAEARLRELVARHDVETIALARYMQILSAQLCADLPGRIINIHHSLLPSFKGAKPYTQAHDRGVKVIGATAHYVTADLDEGPIIEQDTVRVTHAESATELARRGADVERQVLSRAVLWHAQDRVIRHGNHTIVF